MPLRVVRHHILAMEALVGYEIHAAHSGSWRSGNAVGSVLAWSVVVKRAPRLGFFEGDDVAGD